jgi:hypothetical protein
VVVESGQPIEKAEPMAGDIFVHSPTEGSSYAATLSYVGSDVLSSSQEGRNALGELHSNTKPSELA